MMTLTIAPLAAADRARWDVLARGYRDFYKTPTTDAEYDESWRRLLTDDRLKGLGATLDGRLVGIAHYFFHTSIWADNVCYLQDLFVDEATRGRGVARALIHRVADAARAKGSARYYWHTQDHNGRARALYDKIAKYTGFVRYDYPL